MRNPVKQMALLVSIALLISSSSCRSSEDSQAGIDGLSPDAAAGVVIENSGQTLSGQYVLQAVEDDYSPGRAATDAEILFTFDDQGGFKRERFARGAVQASEEGHYIIGASGQLVLYIERAGASQLEAARPELYSVEGQSGNTLKLGKGAGLALILRKK